jgi:phage-related tail fiber protein
MKTRFISLVLFGVFVAVGLSAQTKTSGTVTCKSDPASPVALTDKPNHSFAVGKAQCTWTKFELAGLQSKDGISTDLEEISGDTISVRGYHVATMANGDTTVAKFQGSGKLKDGKPVSGGGTWSYTSGTGKLKGIKGKGAYKGTANPDGSFTYKVDGEYSLP